jgi:hypothetical protein
MYQKILQSTESGLLDPQHRIYNFLKNKKKGFLARRLLP